MPMVRGWEFASMRVRLREMVAGTGKTLGEDPLVHASRRAYATACGLAWLETSRRDGHALVRVGVATDEPATCLRCIAEGDT